MSEKIYCVKQFYFNELKRILSKPWNSNAFQLKNNVMYPSTSNISKYIFQDLNDTNLILKAIKMFVFF
jgi:hypothetical protein